MTASDWITLAIALIVGGNALVVVARFIFRLDAKVDRLDDKVDRLADDMRDLKIYVGDIAKSLAALVERTSVLEGHVEEIPRNQRGKDG